jgi:hypothetical protein
MTSRILLATLGLLALATSVSAEGAWVLWEESRDLQTFQRTAASHPRRVEKPDGALERTAGSVIRGGQR